MKRCSLALVVFLGLAIGAHAQETKGWIVLVGPGAELDAWKGVPGKWEIAGDCGLDSKDPKRLIVTKPGTGVIVQGDRKSGAKNLTSKQTFGDVELHAEFMIPKGSNSGIKFHGHYEIAIQDSWGVPLEKLKGSDCGGLYPRAESAPKYHHIDVGVPPLVNACKAPGEWQVLDAIFVAPRFNAAGEKIESARLVKVRLNGKLIHENLEVKNPTSADWKKKEFSAGPIYLQADHGGVAFRDVRIRPYSTSK